MAAGRAKEAEREWRDRAPDETVSPLDDPAAKGKRLEHELEEEYGETQDPVRRRM